MMELAEAREPVRAPVLEEAAQPPAEEEAVAPIGPAPRKMASLERVPLAQAMSHDLHEFRALHRFSHPADNCRSVWWDEIHHRNDATRTEEMLVDARVHDLVERQSTASLGAITGTFVGGPGDLRNPSPYADEEDPERDPRNGFLAAMRQALGMADPRGGHSTYQESAGPAPQATLARALATTKRASANAAAYTRLAGLDCDDPNLSESLRARQSERLRELQCQWVQQDDPATLCCRGYRVDDLIQLGISFDDWIYRHNFRLADLVNLRPDFAQLLCMGFRPEHLSDRERCSILDLTSPPFNLTFQVLTEVLGFTVEDCLRVGMGSAEFLALGATASDLANAGLTPEMVGHMKEGESQFRNNLRATDEDINHLFNKKPHRLSGYPVDGGGGSSAGGPSGMVEDQRGAEMRAYRQKLTMTRARAWKESVDVPPIGGSITDRLQGGTAPSAGGATHDADTGARPSSTTALRNAELMDFNPLKGVATARKARVQPRRGARRGLDL